MLNWTVKRATAEHSNQVGTFSDYQKQHYLSKIGGNKQ
jgi:hypothetical protein